MNRDETIKYAAETAAENKRSIADLRRDFENLQKSPAIDSLQVEFNEETAEALKKLTTLTDELLEIAENQKEVTGMALNKLDELEMRLNEQGKQISDLSKKKKGRKRKDDADPLGTLPTPEEPEPELSPEELGMSPEPEEPAAEEEEPIEETEPSD